ncbi:MAG: YlbF family regulator [Anaerolineaceae bacterium]|nr:YlbF family regulator [Anaerolineaceae bacterium]
MIDLQTDVPIFAASNASEPLYRLATLLKAHAAYTRFLDTYRLMQADSQTQSLLAELRASQAQGLDETTYHRLLQQFYARPSVKDYQRAEEEIYNLIIAVDKTISEAAGIDFAVNAKRSCCGG